MKVCFQTKTWGEGTGWFAQELARGIAEAGGEIIYVAPPAIPSEREPHHDALHRVLTHREIQSGSKGARIASSLRRVRDGWLACLQARSKTNKYLFSIPDPLLFFLPLQIILKVSGARQFLIVHDAVPHAWVDRIQPPRLQEMALTASYRLATKLIATTNACRDDLISKFGIQPASVSVIPHGIFDIGTPTEIPGNSTLLVFGSLRRNKRVAEVIQAVQLCRSRGVAVQLKIAGAPDRADQAYWNECKAQIAIAPEGIFTEIGFIDDVRVPKLIAECDAAILPYKDFSSASGVAILMATSQRSVIATYTGGFKDLFELGMDGFGLQEPVKPEAIADAIQSLLSIPLEVRRARAANARELLIAALSWARIGEEYVSILEGTS